MIFPSSAKKYLENKLLYNAAHNHYKEAEKAFKEASEKWQKSKNEIRESVNEEQLTELVIQRLKDDIGSDS